MGHVGLRPAVQQHDELRVGAARSAATSGRPRRLDPAGYAHRRLAAGRHQHDHVGRAGHVRLHAGRGVRRVRHRAGLPRRQQLPAEHHVRSDQRQPDHHQLLQRRVRRRRRPIRASRSATRRATASADRTSGSSTRRSSKQLALGVRHEARASNRSVQPAQPDELPGAERQQELGRVRHDHAGTYDARQLQLGAKLLW